MSDLTPVSPDLRALCQELREAYVESQTIQHGFLRSLYYGPCSLLARVDAALATPPAATREARALPQVGAEISDEEWDTLKDRLWDLYETIGHQGERIMWPGAFDKALDRARKELAHWALPVPAADEGEVKDNG